MDSARFVTAKLVGQEDCRQGIVVTVCLNHVVILTESGKTYCCEKNFTVVPLRNLWGSTRKFAVRNGITQ